MGIYIKNNLCAAFILTDSIRYLRIFGVNVDTLFVEVAFILVIFPIPNKDICIPARKIRKLSLYLYVPFRIHDNHPT